MKVVVDEAGNMYGVSTPEELRAVHDALVAEKEQLEYAAAMPLMDHRSALDDDTVDALLRARQRVAIHEMAMQLADGCRDLVDAGSVAKRAAFKVVESDT